MISYCHFYRNSSSKQTQGSEPIFGLTGKETYQHLSLPPKYPNFANHDHLPYFKAQSVVMSYMVILNIHINIGYRTRMFCVNSIINLEKCERV